MNDNGEGVRRAAPSVEGANVELFWEHPLRVVGKTVA